MNKIFGNAFCFLAAIASLIIYACANRGMPEGGPKDETPPVVVKEVPMSGTVNFKDKQIDIYFDEYIQLKDIQTKFVISPPQKKKPKVSLRGKYIRITFADTLKPNTTYSMDFADAIVDNNEGNPFGFYRYVFSTGPVIDSMEVSGQIVDAQTQLPLLNMSVWLYENHADSAALTEIPSYVARTDSTGTFQVTNIKRGSYRVLAIDDTNKDLIFTPEGEKIGFVDTVIIPVMERVMRWDTIRPDTTLIHQVKRLKRGEMSETSLTKDTIVQREYILYGPSNLFMSMFEEEKTLLLLEDEQRPDRERLEFRFSIPAENRLKLRLLGVRLVGELNENDWYIRENTAGNDTLNFWIKDSSVYNLDTLVVERSYMRSDSLQRLQPFKDTIRMYFKDKEPPKKKKKKEEEGEEEKPEIVFLGLNASVGQTQDLHRPIVLEFDKPIQEYGLEKIELFEKVDTNWVVTDYKIHRDSLKLRTYYLEKEWKPETNYQLKVDSATIYSIYGLYNNKVEKTFKTKSMESYGKIIVNVTGVEVPVIMQVYQGDKDVKVVSEKYVTNDGKVTFDFLNEGNYMLRAILDRNANKKWDTGNYLKHIQPEEIKYFPIEINLKQNFDVEQEFDVKKTYTREDPSKKKAIEDKNTKRNRSR